MTTLLRADEVHCRRLVIDDAGTLPRIVGEVLNGVAELRIELGDPPGTHLLLYAGEIAPGVPGLGVELFVEGDSVARLHAWRDGGHWAHQIDASHPR